MFSDTLPVGMRIANGAAATSGCDGTVTAPDGGTTISFENGKVGGDSSCTITVNVTAEGPIQGTSVTYTNVSGDLSSSAGSGGTATADLTVVTTRPGFSKSFSPSTIGFGRKSKLTFSIDNTANTAGAFDLFFTDTLPDGIEIASPSNATTDCTNGTLTAVPGSRVISMGSNNGTTSVAAGSSCTVSVDVGRQSGWQKREH